MFIGAATTVQAADMGVYYVINPILAEFMGEFKYSELFDDPGGSDNFLAGNFRLKHEDMERLEK